MNFISTDACTAMIQCWSRNSDCGCADCTVKSVPMRNYSLYHTLCEHNWRAKAITRSFIINASNNRCAHVHITEAIYLPQYNTIQYNVLVPSLQNMADCALQRQ